MCPVCQAKDVRSFFEQQNVPTQEGYLAPTRDQAIGCTLGRIALCHCPACGHIWNDAFDADLLRFDPEYDISMFHSPAYRAYIGAVIERLKSRYELQRKTALEIACGKGDFLRALIAHGFGEAIGFDPTFADASLSDEDRRSIVAYRAYYDESHHGIKTQLVACRSALQYFREPRGLLTSLRATLADQPKTIVYFEVPNGDETFARRMVWNIAYEHGCFFSPASLARVFGECGFETLDVLSGLGGSQLEIEARPTERAGRSRFESEAQIASITRDVEAFAACRNERVAAWSARMKDDADAGKRVSLWGAGARAISFLCAIDRQDAVASVVDINPKRQGRFLPSSGCPVVSPEALQAEKPDVVVVTNPNFANEIRAKLDELNVRCAVSVLD